MSYNKRKSDSFYRFVDYALLLLVLIDCWVLGIQFYRVCEVQVKA